MANLECRFISKEVIKPSSPTPHHLQTYNLSFSDQICPSIYIPFLFFYPYNGSIDTITTHQENASKLLKKSLSQTLTRYYPFSGKLVSAPDGSYVDCNDEGVDFEEGRVNTRLPDVVVRPHYQTQDKHLFPTGTIWGSTTNNRLVRVQVSYFDCGGLALAVCLSHKIGDTCTLYTFIKHWSAVSHSHNNLDSNSPVALVSSEPQPPHLISTRISVGSELTIHNGKNCVSKRFIFANSKIEKLKAEVGTENPTRVEVINSLVYRCAVRAAKANRTSFYKTFSLVQTVNMRKRLADPLEENTMGNFSWCLQVPTICISDKLDLKSLTTRIQKAKLRLTGMTVSQMNRVLKLMAVAVKYVPGALYESFGCTSLCGYHVYGVDFGWGNPVRVSSPAPDQFFILMDTPSKDGIEALVSLEEEEMAKFEADEQLLAFAFAA